MKVEEILFKAKKTKDGERRHNENRRRKKADRGTEERRRVGDSRMFARC